MPSSHEPRATNVEQRVVVRAPNWLGDAVMALPALGALRSAFADATIAIAAPASVAPLFAELTPARPDAILTIGGNEDEVPLLARGSYDVAVLLPNSFRAAWNARRAGIRERWGYAGHARGWMLTRAVPRPGATLHQSAYYLHLVRGLGVPADDALPHLDVRSDSVQRAAELLEKSGVDPGATLVGYAPGAAYGHAKRWPPHRMADLIARVSRERGAIGMLVGASGDRDAGREIESSLPAGVTVVNLIGRTDLRVLAGVLARCRAFVSNDSGAMHLAAAIGVPVTAMFGPTDDRVTAPLGNHDVLIHQVFCRPCMLRDCPIDHRCMKGISVDAAFTSVTSRL
jgi:heptosyltransferase-2